MRSLADRLNEILAAEWACVRTLRRAEARCDEPGPLEIIRRVRKDCSVNCVSLANIIRALGGRPTDIPSPRFSLQLKDETLPEILDLAQSAQQHIIAEVTALLDEPDLASSRSALGLVLQLHRDDLRWLAHLR
jgi:hypothetical protein